MSLKTAESGEENVANRTNTSGAQQSNRDQNLRGYRRLAAALAVGTRSNLIRPRFPVNKSCLNAIKKKIEYFQLKSYFALFQTDAGLRAAKIKSMKTAKRCIFQLDCHRIVQQPFLHSKFSMNDDDSRKHKDERGHK